MPRGNNAVIEKFTVWFNAVPVIRGIRILAIDERTPNTVPRSVALYDVKGEVDGRSYTCMVSVTEVHLEDRPGLGLEFHDDHHERIFKWRSGLRTEIYNLVVAVFRKQEVTLSAHLGEPDIP